jgi:hypothetical protein
VSKQRLLVDIEHGENGAGAAMTALWKQIDRWMNEGGAEGTRIPASEGRTYSKEYETMLTAQEMPTAAETVRVRERRRIEATRANDVEALSSLLDDGLVYINSAGEVFDKQRYLQAISSNRLSYDEDFDVRESQSSVLDGLVIFVGVMLGHSLLDGERQVFHCRCLSVWREDAGEWRMVAWQSSPSQIKDF